MENVKEIVRENLIKFRKDKKLTQMELSERVGYSDKAISRWETGEVTPDIETLNALSELYEVPLSAFFEKYDKKAVTAKRVKNLQIGNKMAVSLVSIIAVWVLVTMLFIGLNYSVPENPNWLCFIWAIPVTFILALIFNAIWGRRGWTFVFVSCLVWTIILAVYLQLMVLSLHIPLLFIGGAPVQVCIILASFIHSPRSQK